MYNLPPLPSSPPKPFHRRHFAFDQGMMIVIHSGGSWNETGLIILGGIVLCMVLCCPHGYLRNLQKRAQWKKNYDTDGRALTNTNHTVTTMEQPTRWRRPPTTNRTVTPQ